MDQEILKEFGESVKKHLDENIEAKVKSIVGVESAKAARQVVEEMRAEKSLFGTDRTGLSDEQKVSFTKAVKAVAFGLPVATKANEELISEVDSRGGYLIPVEVANAIQRIAASVGLVMSQATKWNMNTDELDIPAYVGSFLEGEYLGVNAAGSLTGVTFNQARLIAKKWQLAFAIGNDLMNDASVDVANWLLALAGEALANKIDKMAFIGGNSSGDPFVGLLNDANVTVQTLASGQSTFTSFNVVDDASDAIASLEESMLDGAAFYMSRTMWAKLRVQKDDAGNYILPQAGQLSAGFLANYPLGGGPRPVGEILGFPVFTSRHLPAAASTAVSTKFIIFGNLKAMAFGSKGSMTLERYNSGTFGGKEIALADQQGMVFKNRHALVLTLPAAVTVIKTAAS